MTPQAQRQLYMVLSPRSLSYARAALESLFKNSADPINLNLVTDSAEDAKLLEQCVTVLELKPEHRCTVTPQDALNDAESSRFANLSNLRAFRHGHPCWRKVTDPLLLSEPGEEMVLLDPDLYFPNRFRFEQTPISGLSLMWQRPNCLLPPHVVRAAMDAHIPLARHVDIGVAHWRSGSDLEWIDWMLGKLGGPNLPRAMHIEAIVWSAIAGSAGTAPRPAASAASSAHLAKAFSHPNPGHPSSAFTPAARQSGGSRSSSPSTRQPK